MPRTEGRRTYATFVGGLITEATGISFPENASVDEQNFVLNRDGSRQRRLGMDLENGYQWADVSGGAASGYASVGVRTFFWDNTGPGNAYDVLVVQYGSRLYFYDTTNSSFGTPLTLSGSSFYNLATHTTGEYVGSDFEKYTCDFSMIRGALVVVGQHIEPFFLTLDDDGAGTLDTITGTEIEIQIRDLGGVKSSDNGNLFSVLAGGELHHDANTLDRGHEYNLKNQGWDLLVRDFQETFGSAATSGPIINPISDFQSAWGAYPRNSDFVYFGFKQDGQWREWENTAVRYEQTIGSIETPKGHFILNAFEKDRNSVSIDAAWISGGSLGTYTEKNRPTTVEAFAGRVWYSGVNSEVTVTASSNGAQNVEDDTNSTKIFFSRTVVSMDRLGQCYQLNDPTHETINELLPNDGGVVEIHDAGRVLALKSAATSIFAICTNGVWEITGSGDGVGFSATSFKINKISNIGGIGRDSVVDAEGTIFYWSDGGIYALSRSELGDWGAQNITESTIQTLYIAINKDARRIAKGHYDEINKQVKWLYNSSTQIVPGVNRYRYDRELVFDLQLGAFYKHHIDASSGVVLADYAPLSGQFTAIDDAIVVAQGHPVVASGQTVGINQEVQGNRGSLTNKYLVVEENAATPKITFGEYASTAFVDWGSWVSGGVDFVSYLVTGYEVFGDPSMVKSAMSVTTFFNRTETGYIGSSGDLEFRAPSGCFLQLRWEWSDSGNSGFWSKKEQVYKFSKFYVPSGNTDTFANGLPVLAHKVKLRGSGRALSLYFESESGKDTWLLGWTINAEGRQST